MSDPLSSLAASTDAAREILESAADGPSFGHWSAVVRGWRRAKQPLIDALDPETGRRVVPYTHDPAPTVVYDAWYAALTGGALRQLDDAVLSARGDRTDAARSRRDLTARFAPPAAVVSQAMAPADAAAGAVQTGSPMLALAGVRAGARLTRAIGAHLRSAGATADEASVLVDAYAAAAQVTTRTGYVVLSANLLDLLCCSEHCSYSSCHSLTGCYRAGPQAYAADDCTLCAYYYEVVSDWRGHSLPRKLARQMIYIDAARQSAALMRRYGSALPDGAWAIVRREVAYILAALRDGARPGAEPKWYRTDTAGLAIDNPAELAYVDPAVECVQLAAGKKQRPQITLAASIPCPSCGEDLDSAGALVCESCERGKVCESCERGKVCCHCGERIDEEDVVHEDGAAYCSDCWSERFVSCRRCGRTLPSDEYESVQDDGPYCTRCADRISTVCEGCDERHHDDDITDGYCPDCLSGRPECADCSERKRDARDCAGELVCGACVAERDDYAPLYRRLLASPRWARSMDGARAVLTRQWATAVAFSWTDLADYIVLAAHGQTEGLSHV